MRLAYIFLFFILFLPKQLLSSTIVDGYNLDLTTAPKGKYVDTNIYLAPFATVVIFGVSSIIDTNTSSIQDPVNLDNLINPNKYLFDDYYFSNNTININASISGGVMFIENNIANDIQILNSTFTKNKIESLVGSLTGGAISSFLDTNFSLTISNSNFIENSIIHTAAVAGSPNNSFIAAGGAILTTTKLNVNNSTFEKNTVNADGYQARGGAIANYGGETTIKDTSFFNNSVVSLKNEAMGGAISNTQKEDLGAGGVLNIVAENKNVVFSGNTMQGTNTGGVAVGNDIYNKGGSTLNLNANTGKNIIFDGGIDGDGTSTININNGASNNTGNIVLNSTIKNNNINLFGGTVNFFVDSMTDYFINAPLFVKGDTNFSLQNGSINSANFGNITADAGKKIFLSLDVDLQSNTIDSIGANILSPDFKFNLGKFQVIKDSIADRAEIDLKDMVSGSLTTSGLNYDDNFPTTASGAIYNYELQLDKTTDILTFIRLSFSPYLYNQTISIRETVDFQRYITQNILDKDKFAFGTNTKKLILSDRIKYRSQPLSIINKNVTIFNLVRVDNEKDAFKLAKGVEVYGKLLKIEETNIEAEDEDAGGFWFNAFGLQDTSKYDNFPSVKNDFFTIFAGLNSKTKFLNNGSKVYSNIYLGYLNGTQKYDKSKIENNGIYVGTTGFYEYKKFVGSLSGNIGFLDNDANNEFGTDNYKNYWFSIGTKFAYNYKFKNTSYLLEPALYLSYTFITADSYKSASNINLKQNNLNSFQASPSLKFVKLFKKNLTVSVKAKYVLEVINDLELDADNILLPELTNDPFIEYGVSLDKKIKDNFLLNLELNRRDGGRRGWILDINSKFYF